MRAAAPIPNFSLYGETLLPAARSERVHVEDIQSRSRKYLWKIGTHRHSVLSQCLLVNEGPVIAVLDDVRSILTGPAVIVVPAGTVHSFKFRAETQGYVLTVDLSRLVSSTIPGHRLPIEALYSAPRTIDLRDDPSLAERLQQLFDLLVHEFCQPQASEAPVCGWLASSVLWILALRARSGGAPYAAGAPDAERLQRFRALMEAHYLRHWPVLRYARELGLSETSLNRLCRRATGCTAFDLIQERLALEARRRLVYGVNAIRGVATELGFKDPAYFSRFFRRRSGASPHEYRRRHRGDALRAGRS